MRYYNLIISVLFLSTHSFGQTERKMTPVHIPDNIERYQDDYELKNYVFIDGDSTILNQINISAFEQFRQMDENVEIQLENIHQTLVLYSVNSVGRKEKNTTKLISNQ